MKKSFILISAIALLTAGCTVNVTTGAPSESSSTGASTGAPSDGADSVSPSESTSPADPPTSSSAPAAPKEGLTFVSGNLAAPGRQGPAAVAGMDSIVVASTYNVISDTNTDVGFIFSTDSGQTWTNSGVLALPDSQSGRAVLLTSKGAVVVGTTSKKVNDRYTYEAFAAIAPAPDYKLAKVDLPSEFAGNVSLADIRDFDGVWTIFGSIKIPESKNSTYDDNHLVIWRSSDEGGTWSKQMVSVKGSDDTSIDELAVAPDGSWNIFGQEHNTAGKAQFSASWVQSTDQGKTFQLVNRRELSAAYDQGAYTGVFSPDGKVAILGWDEVTESGDEVSALWSDANGSFQRLGSPKIPVAGGGINGEFMDGVLFDGETLIGWGSPSGEYPTKEVQFWAWAGKEFTPGYTLTNDGLNLGVGHVLSNGGQVLIFGYTGESTEEADIAIWSGTLTK